jgi:hypothetical protein
MQGVSKKGGQQRTHQSLSRAPGMGRMRPLAMAGASQASPSVTASALAAEPFLLHTQHAHQDMLKHRSLAEGAGAAFAKKGVPSCMACRESLKLMALTRAGPALGRCRRSGGAASGGSAHTC